MNPSLLISRVNMNMGSRAAGQPEPTPAHYESEALKQQLGEEGEEQILPSSQDGSSNGDSGPGARALHQHQMLFLRLLHQPALPRPIFHFLILVPGISSVSGVPSCLD